MNKKEKLHLVRVVDHPKFHFKSVRILNNSWPKYLDQDDRTICPPLLGHKCFKFYQFYVLSHKGELIACIRSVPIRWNRKRTGLPSGFTAMLNQAYMQNKKGVTPNTLGMVSITIAPEYQGKGYSYAVLNELRKFSIKKKFSHIILPVRPSSKSNFPEISLKKYLSLKNENGEIYDNWVRAHLKFGSKIIKISYNSLVIKKKISYWKRILKISAIKKNSYRLPFGISLLKVDRKSRTCTYREPNIWFVHRCTSTNNH